MLASRNTRLQWVWQRVPQRGSDPGPSGGRQAQPVQGTRWAPRVGPAGCPCCGAAAVDLAERDTVGSEFATTRSPHAMEQQSDAQQQPGPPAEPTLPAEELVFLTGAPNEVCGWMPALIQMSAMAGAPRNRRRRGRWAAGSLAAAAVAPPLGESSDACQQAGC